MKRRHSLALLFILLPALATLPGCAGEAPTNTNVATSSPPGPNTRARLDAALEGMAAAGADFRPPGAMKLGEETLLSFAISPKQTPKEMAEELREQLGSQQVEPQSIKISDEMIAQLDGGPDAFDIVPVTKERQYVIMGTPTKWVWRVVSKKSGTQHLNLHLFAVVPPGEGMGEQQIPIRPFNPKSYTVAVSTPFGRVWPWLLPALLLPAGGVAAWLWLRGSRRRRRRAAAHWFTPGSGEAKIFLSYRRDDSSGHTGRLRDALVERFGPGRVFMDLDSIRGGDDFVVALEEAVASCAAVVVVIGRRWLSATDKKGNRRLDDEKDFVRLEVEAALRRDVKVVPALVQGAEMPGADALPATLSPLARRNAVELSDSRWDYDTGRLIEVIEGALAREPAAKPQETSLLPG